MSDASLDTLAKRAFYTGSRKCRSARRRLRALGLRAVALDFIRHDQCETAYATLPLGLGLEVWSGPDGLTPSAPPLQLEEDERGILRPVRDGAP